MLKISSVELLFSVETNQDFFSIIPALHRESQSPPTTDGTTVLVRCLEPTSLLPAIARCKV